MLISFTVENWMSFRDKTTFSMVAGEDEQHLDRVPEPLGFESRVLPFAAIFGSNSSGKSAFCHALGFLKNLVVHGTRAGEATGVMPYLADNEYTQRPSSFCIEVLIKDVLYEFSVKLNAREILEEKLVRTVDDRQSVLYFRYDGEMHFSDQLSELDFLNFAFRGTRSNQLFITNTVMQSISVLRPLYDWFNDSLILLTPDCPFEPFYSLYDEADTFLAAMNQALSVMGTGIVRLELRDAVWENLQLPGNLKDQIERDASEGRYVHFALASSHERYIATRSEGVMLLRRMVTVHAGRGRSEFTLELSQESSGVRQLLNLLPAFIDLCIQGTDRLYVVDGFEHSLHPLLVRSMIKGYLAYCTELSRMQLVMTTHGVELLDFEVVRPDEIWFTDRSSGGATFLTPLIECPESRNVEDLREDYLKGILGSIPNFKYRGR